MKVQIAIFFYIIFLNLIVTPAIISLIDNTQKIPLVMDISEEKNKNGKEVFENLETEICETQISFRFLFKGIQKKKNIRFNSKNYISISPKILTPPPEFVLYS